jgi:hypothetical protein
LGSELGGSVDIEIEHRRPPLPGDFIIEIAAVP